MTIQPQITTESLERQFLNDLLRTCEGKSISELRSEFKLKLQSDTQSNKDPNESFFSNATKYAYEKKRELFEEEMKARLLSASSTESIPPKESNAGTKSVDASKHLEGTPQPQGSRRTQSAPLPERRTADKTRMVAEHHLSPNPIKRTPPSQEIPQSAESIATPVGRSPVTSPVDRATSVEEASTVVAPVVAPATLTLQSNASPTHHFKAKLKWGEHEYLVEQDLPPKTTPEDWQAIVHAYEQILNATENSPQCHPGINQLKLKLDTDHRVMNIEIPDVKSKTSISGERAQPITIAVRGRIVTDLLNYHTHPEESSALQFYRPEETLPDSEIHTPLGLANKTGTLCYANALLQMIMAYPYLRETIAAYSDNEHLRRLISTYSTRSPKDTEISSLDNRALADIIRGTGSLKPRQEDILDAFESLITNASKQHAVYENLSAALPLVEQVFRVTETQTVPPEYAIPNASDPSLYTRTIQGTGSQLPILTLNPDPIHPMTLSQAILKSSEWEKHTPALDAAPSDQALLIAERKRFHGAPKTLVIHANRTPSNGSKTKNKGKIALSEKVAIPGILVSEENTPPLYQLRSFAVHSGDQTTEGHYTAYVKVKGIEGETLYYKMDDSSKQPINQKDFLDASENFALAFYDNISEVVEDRQDHARGDDATPTSPIDQSIPPSPIDQSIPTSPVNQSGPTLPTRARTSTYEASHVSDIE